MISQALRKARKYEKDFGKMIRKEERPHFHLTACTGWMNDPNGFSYYNGKYHLFYQYYPYESKWGPMHWGHAMSGDLLNWEYLPAAMAPDEAYDKDGCFSGSALTLPDGRQLLMYTGVARAEESENVFFHETQCLAVGNGTDYEKYVCNPVLGKKDLPGEGNYIDFRDPKMWRRKDGTYCCIVGSRPADGSGQILLYTSADGFQWKFQTILVSNKERFGKMWECPDFFKLDGTWVLLTSPQDMAPKEFEYHNGNGTLCLMGDFDEETYHFTEKYDQAVDYGIDFYAPQTVLSPDGRRIMIGWMQNWDSCAIRSQKESWFGQMSLPRELSVKNGRLYQRPVRELDELRHNQAVYSDVTFSGGLALEGIRGRQADIELTLRPGDEKKIYEEFVIRFAQDGLHYTSLSFRPRESILKVDRRFSGSRRAIIHERQCKVSSVNGNLKLRIILDRFSVETFVNDGEHALTATMYTELSADGISFFADGNVSMDVVKYELGPHI